MHAQNTKNCSLAANVRPAISRQYSTICTVELNATAMHTTTAAPVFHGSKRRVPNNQLYME